MAGIRRPGVDGNTIMYWLINLVLNWEGLIPAVIALVLHFAIGLDLKWFWGLLVLWFAGVTLVYFILCKVMNSDYTSAPKRTAEEQEEHDRQIREYSRNLRKNKREQ